MNSTLNQSGFNETEFNQTNLNLTTNQTLPNATILDSSDDPEMLAFLKEKFKLKTKLRFKSLKKRIVDINGTNVTLYDLSISKLTDRKKKSLPGDLDLQKALLSPEDQFEESSIEIIGLRNIDDLTPLIPDSLPDKIELFKTESSNGIAYPTTDFIGFASIDFESAIISLPVNGQTETLLVCNDYDSSSDSCNSWSVSDIPFSDNGESITFTVSHFSGYAGANITILNLQSYPVVGSNWTVRFLTNGTAPLTITAV
ncbi:MAG: hypothetical protein ABH863_06180, partial [Candidatus Micrarchaeota archaeon]